MPTALDLLFLIFEFDAIAKENIPVDNIDVIGWAAILLFLGGIAFWCILLFGAVVGFCRGVKRLYDSARDVISGRRVSIPHNES